MDLAALMKGRRVLVTGASGGLGAHFAKLAARCGAAVAIGARRRDKLKALAEELRGLTKEPCTAVDLDVTSEKSVGEAFNAVEQQLGVLDVVVNNAGITRIGTATELSAADFDDVVATNLRGVWLVSTEAARRWKAASRPGVIVNISSITAMRAANQIAPYALTKAAVDHMTRSLALDWARYGIRVNALAPGYIETDLNAEFFASEPGKAMIKRIPMRRLGNPEDLDGAFLLLATDASRWMTGTSLVIDGGHLTSTL
jgi:NAD(P)-dependent dehydrogenase (short-subunit alcohol dehydrogenase family)